MQHILHIIVYNEDEIIPQKISCVLLLIGLVGLVWFILPTESGHIFTDSIPYLTLGLSSGISCGENASAAPVCSTPCHI